MEWTRRRFLASRPAAAVTVLARGRARAAAPAADRTTLAMVEALRGLVMQRALVSDDPWVLMHVVLALGPDFADADGLDPRRRRRRALLHDGREGRPLRTRAFPLNVEAHPNHFLEIMEAIARPVDAALRDRGPGDHRRRRSPGRAPRRSSRRPLPAPSSRGR